MQKALPTQQDVNIFLDVVRSSGVTNMFGAGPYVEDHFKVDCYKAKEYLVVWMRTFAERRARGEVVD